MPRATPSDAMRTRVGKISYVYVPCGAVVVAFARCVGLVGFGCKVGHKVGYRVRAWCVCVCVCAAHQRRREDLDGHVDDEHRAEEEARPRVALRRDCAARREADQRRAERDQREARYQQQLAPAAHGAWGTGARGMGDGAWGVGRGRVSVSEQRSGRMRSSRPI